jgi:tail assembly chaperone
MAERKIGTDTYRFEKLNAFEGLRLAGRVVKFLGPAWGYIDRMFNGDESARDAGAILAIAATVKDLDVDQLIGFLKELTGYCQIKLNGAYEPVVPEVHMRTEIEILQVSMFVLEIQFKDFFGAAKGSRLGVAILGSQLTSSGA